MEQNREYPTCSDLIVFFEQADIYTNQAFTAIVDINFEMWVNYGTDLLIKQGIPINLVGTKLLLATKYGEKTLFSLVPLSYEE